MPKKKLVQIIALVFLVIGLLLLIPHTSWTERISVVGFISLTFGTLGSIISIFIPTVYTFSFCESDWVKNNHSNDFSLLIAAKKHGLGTSPKVYTFSKDNKTFSEVGVYIHHDDKGNVTIGATATFKGKAIIT